MSNCYYVLGEYLQEENRRRRRNVNVKPTRIFNRYTRSITERNQQDAKSRSRRSMSFKNDNTLTTVSLKRATIFDCYDDSEAICMDAKIVINNFVSGNKAIQLNVKFDLDLSVFREFFEIDNSYCCCKTLFMLIYLDNIVTDSKDIFVIKPSVEINKTGDEDG